MPTGIYQRKPRSEETKKKISLAHLGRENGPAWNKGKPHSEVHRVNLKKAWEIRKKRGDVIWNKGKKHTEEHKKNLSLAWKERKFSGPDHPRWIKDREKLAKHERHTSSAYKDWRIKVYRRDLFRCKISNSDCKGRIEAHHILSWKDHYNLRYEVNNGITLCHAHHPKTRIQESKLSPYFKELINNLN